MEKPTDVGPLCQHIIQTALHDVPLARIERQIGQDRSEALRDIIGPRAEKKVAREKREAASRLARHYRRSVKNDLEWTRLERALRGQATRLQKQRRHLPLNDELAHVGLLGEIDQVRVQINSLGDFQAISQFCEYYRGSILLWIGYLSRSQTTPAEIEAKAGGRYEEQFPFVSPGQLLSVATEDQRVHSPTRQLGRLPSQFQKPADHYHIFQLSIGHREPEEGDLFSFPEGVPQHVRTVFKGQAGTEVIRSQMAAPDSGGTYLRVGVEVTGSGMDIFPVVLRKEHLREEKGAIRSNFGEAMANHIDQRILPRLEGGDVIADVESQSGDGTQIIFET